MYKTFTVKEEHLKLLQNMTVGWQNCETGAPEIDPKRPYGNSDVVEDIHYILKGERINEDELEEKGIDYYDFIDSIEEEYLKLHRETDTVLEIVLHTMLFEAGRYKRHSSSKKWMKMDLIL